MAAIAATDARGDLRVGRTGLSRSGFDEALSAILDKHVEPVDRDEVLTRGLKAMVGGLDPHSRFLTAAERKLLRDRAGTGSSGLSVSMRDSPFEAVVTGVVPGSPAADAGLQPGDRVLAIGRRNVADLGPVEAEAALLGQAGDRVELSLAAPHYGGSPREVALELAPVSRERVETRLVDVAGGGKVGCIRIHEFRSEVGREVKKALAKLRRRAPKKRLAGLVLDLRSNPGGEVDQALVVADMFIADGVLTRTRGRDGRVLREERAHARGTDDTTPIVVLVDEYTASAAELLAAALHDHGRAKLIGRETYGKGTVQQILGLPDGSVLSLTIARYFSPHDERIDGVGLRPDEKADWSKLSKKASIEVTVRALGLAPA